MKTFLFRISSVIIAFALGCGIFLILTYAGNKSKGPLSDLFTTFNSGVAEGGTIIALQLAACHKHLIAVYGCQGARDI